MCQICLFVSPGEEIMASLGQVGGEVEHPRSRMSQTLY